MLIGEVSRRSGVSTRMLRHYESLGLVRPSGRTSGGYREYSAADVRRIFHVESLRTLGLSLSEVAFALDDPDFSPAALVAELLTRTRQRITREQELLVRLRDVADAEPHDWDEVLGVVALLRGLASGQPPARQHAVLTAASDPRLPAGLAVGSLAEALLAEPEQNVAGTLQWALARAGREALPALAVGLTSPQPEVRRRAVDAIAAIDGDEAASLLRDALRDPDDVVRSHAAVELGTRGGREALPTLVELVAAGTGDVEAAEALGHLAADPRGAAHIAGLLTARAEGSAPPVRLRIVQALAEIPGEGARLALASFADDDDPAVARTARAILGAARRPDPTGDRASRTFPPRLFYNVEHDS